MTALYEWNYPRQMLRIRLTEAEGASLDEREAQIFSEPFLLGARCSRPSPRSVPRCC